MNYVSYEKKFSALIFIGGEGPDSLCLHWEAGILFAADSGYDLCKKLGYVPDILMGDMDSIAPQSLKELPSTIKKYTFIKDKDYTDTQLCLRVAKDKNYKDITIIGGGGGRIDHFIGLLYLFYGKLAPTRIITTQYHIEYMSEKNMMYTISVKKGSVISLFPVPNIDTRVKSKGLKWELDNIVLSNHTMISLSNECSDDLVMLNIQQGSLIVVWEHNEIIERPAIENTTSLL